MRRSLFAFACLCLLAIAHCDQQQQQPKRKLKILFNSPVLCYSHLQFHGHVADVLAEAGHEVHFLSVESSPRSWVHNYPGALKVNKTITVPRTKEQQASFVDMGVVADMFGAHHDMLFSGNMANMQEKLAQTCGYFLTENRQLIEELRRERYDVGISEFFDPCMFGVFHHLGIRPALGTDTIGVASKVAAVFGVPTFASYVPNHWNPPLGGGASMDFPARFRNFYNELYEVLRTRKYVYELEQAHFTKAFGPDFPSLLDITRNVSLGFFNANEFFEFPRPLSNKLIYIGGLVEARVAKRPLGEDYQRIFAKARKGVVIFSLGSVADTKMMDVNLKRNFVRTLSRFPDYEFIWRLELTKGDEDLLANATNIHTFEWLDVRSLLVQPTLRAFISHCGYNSINEAAYAGVPTLCIPLFFDQLYDSLLVKHKGFSLHVDINEVKEGRVEVLHHALEQILVNASYAEKAQLLKRKMNARPFSAAERLVKWVEFAAEFPEGLDELNLPGDELGWIVYYSLDVIGVSAAVVAAVLWAVAKALVTIVKGISGQGSGKGKEKRQ